MAKYVPGLEAQKYRRLSQADRAAVNEETNQLFADRTGVTRKLDPARDQDLVVRWLTIRDEVMKSRAAKPSATSPSPTKPPPPKSPAPKPPSAPKSPSPTPTDISYDDIDDLPPRWLEIAREELALGVTEISGRQHNPRIMQYIYTCPNIFDNPTYTWSKRHPKEPRRSDQEIYVEREGEEAVDWCSCFVNWCVKQAGLIGTNHALAGSWLKWGQKLDKPRVGAIVVLTWKGTRADHVAFVDKQNGEWKLLGGNQTPTSGVGGAIAVSLRPFNPKTAMAYIWP
jgi:uncharacterized protein (TIGR02594 family)